MSFFLKSPLDEFKENDMELLPGGDNADNHPEGRQAFALGKPPTFLRLSSQVFFWNIPAFCWANLLRVFTGGRLGGGKKHLGVESDTQVSDPQCTPYTLFYIRSPDTRVLEEERSESQRRLFHTSPSA